MNNSKNGYPRCIVIIGSCISMNGWLSESFNLNRGIRQGCPLSALLFIIAVEMSVGAYV